MPHQPEHRASRGLLAASWVAMAFTYAVDTPLREDHPIGIAPTAKANDEGFDRHGFGVGASAWFLLASAAARIRENRAQPGKMSKDETEA